MKNLVIKNKTKKFALISRVWIFTLFLAVVTFIASVGYAASTEKSKANQPKEVTVLDPFQLIIYKVDNQKISNIATERLLTSTVRIRPKIRIPCRPILRSPFRPTFLNW